MSIRTDKDQESRRASGIPRMSRLPVPQNSSLRKSVNSAGIRATHLLGSRSYTLEEDAQPQAFFVADNAKTKSTAVIRCNKSPTKEPQVSSQLGLSRCLLTSSGDFSQSSGNDPVVSALLVANNGGTTGSRTDATESRPETPRQKRKPSLSDRTIETLSQIPPSPSTNRRRSSFYNADTVSPMLPPLRPASAMSNVRARPLSPTKRPPVPPLPSPFITKSNSGPRPASGQAAFKTSTYTGYSKIVGSKSIHPQPSKTSPMTRPSSSSQVKHLSSRASAGGSPTRRQPDAAKSSDSFGTPISKTASSSSRRSPKFSSQPLQSYSTAGSVNADKATKPLSNTSAALRNAIAKAKRDAAERIAPANPIHRRKASSPGPGLRIQLREDILDMGEESGLLKKRVKAALLSGHLNVAAMDLTSIPSEVVRMYAISKDVGVDWSECVDITRFIAADNKLERLDNDIFPDASDAELEDAKDAGCIGPLRGLGMLDVHNNLLKELPLGLRRLQHLRSLNLSGNKLGADAFGVVGQIGDRLTELRMAENELSGTLPDQIKNLPSLQVLDLHKNQISELPAGLQELVHLRILNLASNRLTSISSELLASSTLIELIVSGNQLSGVLFPLGVPSNLKSLKLLDVSHNALDTFTTAEIALPSVQTMNLSGNRFETLPDISSLEELLTFAVAENLLSEIVPGLVMLRKLRNADLSNNNITKIDEGIGSMEDLVSINLSGNPLRERKFLTMSTDDLKNNLQKRRLGLDTPQEGVIDIPVSNPGTGGILDLSSRSLSNSELPTANLNSSVYDCRLHRNALSAIPACLLSRTSISETLRSLDISHNPLEVPYLASTLSLPQLEEMSLASCYLRDLDSLTCYTSAPKLRILDLSRNQLSGSLPQLRTHFSSLTILLAADNRFSALGFEAVRGLTTLDIRNNEIDHLEPRLGLLGGDGGLRCLEVGGNKFRIPRWDVIEKGTEAVLRYLKGRVPLEEFVDDDAGR